MVHIHNDAHVYMSVKKPENLKTNLNRIALTARLSLDAYDAITEIQRQYRRKTGRHKCLWEILDAAIDWQKSFCHSRFFVHAVYNIHSLIEEIIPVLSAICINCLGPIIPYLQCCQRTRASIPTTFVFIST